MLNEFLKKITEPKIDLKHPQYVFRLDAEDTIASVSVLLVSEGNETVVSIYDNKNRLSECMVQVTLNPNDKDCAKNLGEAIIKAINLL